MSNHLSLWLLCIGVGFLGCRGGSSSDGFTTVVITDVEDGNTIRYNNRRYDLLGIEDNSATRAFLESYVIGKEVRLRRDASSIRVGQGTPVYANLSSGLALNGEILRRGLSRFQPEGITDSLSTYNRYAGNRSAESESRSSENERPERIRPERSRPDRSRPSEEVATVPPASTPSRARAFKDLVREREKGVFLIINYGNRGQGGSIGTGFFINDRGLAVSNYHVLDGGRRWSAKLIDGTRLPIEEVLYEDEANDFVVFRVDLGNTRIVPVPVSRERLEKGEEIFVLGNPNGLESTLTRGVISAVRRNYEGMDETVQIDAAISPGSSGSPIMNMRGEVLAIATFKRLECENCNFGVSMNTVLKTIGDE